MLKVEDDINSQGVNIYWFYKIHLRILSFDTVDALETSTTFTIFIKLS